ncbi:MAG: hypothetical protein H6735_34065 [Alphaproteobacteria bacterium]|nr:hypothetical protein [Alphaproteobacteria bacterium]
MTDLSACTERTARRLLAEEPRRCVRYRTDERGHVVFRPSRLAALVAGALALIALPARAGATEQALTVHYSSIPRTPDPPGPGMISLHVEDVDGRSIGGARVALLDPAGVEQVVITADVDGWAHFRWEPRHVAVKITHPTFHGLTLEGLRSSDLGQTVVVRLSMGGPYELGMVVGPQASTDQRPAEEPRDEDGWMAVQRERRRKRLYGVLRLVTEPGRLRRAALRCSGVLFGPIDLSSGSGAFDRLPEGKHCTLRISGARTAVVRFVVGTEEGEVAVMTQ